MENSIFSTWITSLYWSQPSSVVFAFKTATFGPEKQISICPRHHLSFCACNTACQNNLSLWVPNLICGFCMQNSDFWSRITSIYVSQLSSVVFAYTTAHSGPEFQVCTGPRLHLWFWAHITACLTQEYKDYMCSSPRLWFCACKTATLALELLVSMGPSPHLCFLLAKQRLLDPNNKSPLVPDITCRFVHAIQRD